MPGWPSCGPHASFSKTLSLTRLCPGPEQACVCVASAVSHQALNSCTGGLSGVPVGPALQESGRGSFRGHSRAKAPGRWNREACRQEALAGTPSPIRASSSPAPGQRGSGISLAAVSVSCQFSADPSFLCCRPLSVSSQLVSSGVCSWDGPVYLFPALVSGPTVCGVRLAVCQQVVTERALRQEDADVASEQGSISRQRVAVRSVCRDRGWWSSGCGRGVFPGSMLLRLCGCGGW